MRLIDTCVGAQHRPVGWFRVPRGPRRARAAGQRGVRRRRRGRPSGVRASIAPAFSRSLCSLCHPPHPGPGAARPGLASRQAIFKWPFPSERLVHAAAGAGPAPPYADPRSLVSELEWEKEITHRPQDGRRPVSLGAAAAAGLGGGRRRHGGERSFGGPVLGRHEEEDQVLVGVRVGPGRCRSPRSPLSLSLFTLTQFWRPPAAPSRPRPSALKQACIR